MKRRRRDHHPTFGKPPGRVAARTTGPSLASRIESARLAAINLLRLADLADEASPHRKRLRSMASRWEAKADELERQRRGKQTLTIVTTAP